MTIAIAYLGPKGTYTEAAALGYQTNLQHQGQDSILLPYPSIAQTLKAVINSEADLAVVPVENSIQGSVAMTLDSIWQWDGLKIQQALLLKVNHTLLSYSSLANIHQVYSHPQALGQCQNWLDQNLPQIKLIPTNSTTEALEHLLSEDGVGAIASQRAAELYGVPVVAEAINDYPDNCTRFWVVGLSSEEQGNYISLAFSVAANVPGTLVKPLTIFAHRGINLTRIESRPTKRLLGEYLFFLDLEASLTDELIQECLEELAQCTNILKIFGNYGILAL